MPDGKTYKYDVFISYTTVERPWASKLFDELEKLGIRTFMDTNRLEPGQKWGEELRTAVRSSRHLVALWSNNAKGL